MRAYNFIRKLFFELNYIMNKKQKRDWIKFICIILVSSFFELIGVSAIVPFMQLLVNAEKIKSIEFVNKTVAYLKLSNTQIVVAAGIGFAFIYIVKNLFIIFSNYCQAEFGTRIQKDISLKVLNSYMKKNYEDFVDVNSADIVRAVSTDTTGVYFIVTCISTILTESVAIIMISIYLFITEVYIATFVLLALGFVMAFIITVFKPVIKKIGQENICAIGYRNKFTLQAASGMKEITVLQRKEEFILQFENTVESVRKTQCMYDTLNSTPERIIEGLCVGGIVVAVSVRVGMERNVIDFIPTLAMFAMAAFKVFPSIGKVINRINGLVFYRPTLTSIYTIFSECEGDKRKEIIENKVENNIHFEKLEIRNLYWKYKENTECILKNVCIEMKKGDVVGVIGASGSGKTTLVDIILGLFKPTSGYIKINDRILEEISNQWARLIGYVPQDIYMLDDTIKRNVAFGLSADKIDENRVWEVLEKAQLREYVAGLKYGLETVIGERGVKMSGGQCQRIAIARALYNNPEVIVLDEATSSLDTGTEDAIMDAVERLQGKVSMIIIAHKYRTIQCCDRIYEVKDGNVNIIDKTKINK